MRKSVEVLKQFLETEYIHNPEMGSGGMSSAIRDVLTDLMHLGDDVGVSIAERLSGAEEVYNQEAMNELSAKTGVTG